MSTGDPQFQSSLTILFEAPFWIGLYERIDNGKYEVCKITFGAEPKDYEIYEFLLKNWGRLRFSPPIKAEVRRHNRHLNSSMSNTNWSGKLKVGSSERQKKNVSMLCVRRKRRQSIVAGRYLFYLFPSDCGK